MTTSGDLFLPDRLRPGTPHRQRRRRVASLAVLPAALLLLPLWRISAVQIDACPGLPTSVERNLHQLVGTSPVMLDLDWVRQQVEVWPAVGSVEVSFEAPGTVRVTARESVASGSVRVGRTWHGVAADGHLSGAMPEPRVPVLEGFSASPTALRLGLTVARRIERATGGTVVSVRQVLPGDLEVRLVQPAPGTRPMSLRVAPTATAAERAWCARVAAGTASAAWVDLRWQHRMVVRGDQPTPGEAT